MSEWSDGMKLAAAAEGIRAWGKPDCTNLTCTRHNGKCVGYHCPHCDKPVGMMGHDCPDKPA